MTANKYDPRFDKASKIDLNKAKNGNLSSIKEKPPRFPIPNERK